MPKQLFGEFEFDSRTGELRSGTRSVRLAPQPARVLELLASRPGQLIAREEIRREIWGEAVTVDFAGSLNSCIRQIRRALGDETGTPRYIQTLPRRGYRFTPSVTETAPTPPARPRGPSPPKRVRRPLVIALAVVALGALAVGAHVSGVRTGLGSLLGPPPIDSIAVLPLENHSGDPERGYLADGLTDELITQLARIGALKVISRTSVMRYKGSRQPLPEIARELEVDAVVEGSVIWREQRVRITVQLVRASTDAHIWADSFEGDPRDILAVQSEVARAIAREIRVRVAPEEQERLARTRTVDPRAYRLYLQARHHWNRRVEGFEKAVRLFHEAINRDPTWARAFSGLGDLYAVLPAYGALSPREGYTRARAAAERALALDSSLGEPWATLGHVLMTYEWDWEGAERAFRRALELSPGYATGHQWYAECLSNMGRHDEALSEIQRAWELDPLSPVIATNVATVYYSSRRYREAEEAVRNVLKVHPDRFNAHTRLGFVCLATGRPEEALAHFEQVPILSANRALAYVGMGETGEAWRLFHALEERSREDYVPDSWRAILLAHLGEKDRAFQLLDASLDQREWWATRLEVSPVFDPLRDDPRFDTLLQRVGFPGV